VQSSIFCCIYYFRQGRYAVGADCLSFCHSVSGITIVISRLHWNLVL